MYANQKNTYTSKIDSSLVVLHFISCCELKCDAKLLKWILLFCTLLSAERALVSVVFDF